tara:strand:+ start:6108 stop:8813 length:2706 start_codon:yes stop_codon:yes gene_type:complete
MDYKKLATDGFKFINVNTEKQPVDKAGNKIAKWNTLTAKQLKLKTNFNAGKFGIVLGEQDNYKLILSLDFDCCKLQNGEYVDCVNTIEYLKKFNAIGNNAGMFKSSTEGNYNVLIDYTNTTILKDKLLSMEKSSYKSKSSHLELLLKGQQVIPPTATKCKRSGDLNEREPLSEHFTNVIEDGDDVSEFILDYINTFPKPKQLTPSTPKVGNNYTRPTDCELKKIIDIIDITYINDYSVWRNIVWAIKNEGFGFEIAEYFSEKSSDKFNKDKLIKLWDDCPLYCELNMGTIKHFSKLSNETAYTNIIHDKLLAFEELFDDRSDKCFAELGYELIKDDIVYTKYGELYVYITNFWKRSDAGVKNILQNSILRLCEKRKVQFENQKKEYENEEDADNEAVIDIIKKQISKLNEVKMAISSVSKMENVFKQLKIDIVINESEIEFDVNTPDVFCFKNVAFDLNTCKEYNIKKTDYITLHTGYNYTPPTQKEIDEIDKIVKSVFQDEEMRKTYLSVLRTGLSGNRQEKLFMANGSGRNGKGLVNELMSELCGNYAHKLNISVLTHPIKSGANPEVANLHHKRWVVANEPNDDECILAGNIKRLTGDNVISARPLYGCNEITNLDLTLVIELNKMIKLNGRIDRAIMERLVAILFNSYFTSNESVLADVESEAQRGNEFYKKVEFRRQYKTALFHYLLNNVENKLYVCKQAQDDTASYLEDNNDMLAWFREEYQQSDDITAFVRISDIFTMWKQSDNYINLPKATKRKMSRTAFLQEHIYGNPDMRKFYKRRFQIKDPITKAVIKTISEVLRGWKKEKCLIKDDDINSDDETINICDDVVLQVPNEEVDVCDKDEEDEEDEEYDNDEDNINVKNKVVPSKSYQEKMLEHIEELDEKHAEQKRKTKRN